MASSSASKYFEIPKFFVFGEKGIYSGSAAEKDFNYKIVPICPKEGDKSLKAFVWSGQKCLDKSENVTEKEFPLSEEGHRQMLDWLEELYLSKEEVKTLPQRQQEYSDYIVSKYLCIEDYIENHEKNGD